MSDDSIGMMDKAYFVGKVVIIQWLNELLGVSARFLSHSDLCSFGSPKLRSAPQRPFTAA